MFCKAGGASYGMFWVDPLRIDITGVDNAAQSNYPFKFIRADFREVDLSNYNFIWASPPCQRYSRMTPIQYKYKYPDYIPELRSILTRVEIPYCIENVPCSPLKTNLKLTGQMFNREFNKERWFETSFFLLSPGKAYRRYNPKPFIHTSNKKDRSILSWMNHKEFVNAVPPEYSYYILSNYLDQVKTRAPKNTFKLSFQGKD